MIRAVLEGTAFAISHNLHIANEVGTPVDEVRAVGAPTQNASWCQIIADVTGYPLTVMPDNAGAPLGNALLVAHAVGLFDDLTCVADILQQAQITYTPRQTYRKRYDDLFATYCQLYPALKPHFAVTQHLRDM